MRPGSSNRVTPLQAGHWLARWSLETWSWRGKKKIRFLNLILAGYLTPQLRIVLLALLEHLRNFFVWMACLQGLALIVVIIFAQKVACSILAEQGVPSVCQAENVYSKLTRNQLTDKQLQHRCRMKFWRWFLCESPVHEASSTNLPLCVRIGRERVRISFPALQRRLWLQICKQKREL